MSTEATAYFPAALSKASELTQAASTDCRAHSESPPSLNTVDTPRTEQSDDDLLFEVSRGSKEALSTLFQRHARHVFNVAQRILKDTSEAEDLLQDLFLFVFQKAQLFDPAKASAASWIIQMTYHRALDRRRYLDFRQHYDHQEFKEDQFHATRGEVLIDQVTARTLLNKLREKLSTEQRQTLELHFFEGFSFHEIADKTGQTHGNVRNHYYRGLERLRSHIFMEKPL
jgi:RNA polymerase sigma-70 factor (ECF subfamily)